MLTVFSVLTAALATTSCTRSELRRQFQSRLLNQPILSSYSSPRLPIISISWCEDDDDAWLETSSLSNLVQRSYISLCYGQIVQGLSGKAKHPIHRPLLHQDIVATFQWAKKTVVSGLLSRRRRLALINTAFINHAKMTAAMENAALDAMAVV